MTSDRLPFNLRLLQKFSTKDHSELIISGDRKLSMPMSLDSGGIYMGEANPSGRQMRIGPAPDDLCARRRSTETLKSPFAGRSSFTRLSCLHTTTEEKVETDAPSDYMDAADQLSPVRMRPEFHIDIEATPEGDSPDDRLLLANQLGAARLSPQPSPMSQRSSDSFGPLDLPSSSDSNLATTRSCAELPDCGERTGRRADWLSKSLTQLRVNRSKSTGSIDRVNVAILPSSALNATTDATKSPTVATMRKKSAPVSRQAEVVRPEGSKMEPSRKKLNFTFNPPLTKKLSFLRKRSTCSALYQPQAIQAVSIGAKISKEDVKRWAQSFDELLKDKHGVQLFRAFLQKEFSDENIEFWLAVEDYKKLKGGKILPKAQRIYGDFVAVQSPREVNLDSNTRSATIENFVKPNKHTFDQAQHRITALMEKDSYPRFLRSDMYLDLVRSSK